MNTLMTRTSAGRRSPNLTSMTSPTTRSSARVVFFSPPRMTTACCGTMFLNESMIREDLASWKQENTPVKMTTMESATPSHKLSLGASSYVASVIPQARKHRNAPIHSRMAKPPNRFLQNFTHSGMVLGGERAFGPSRLRISAARCSVRPYFFELLNLTRQFISFTFFDHP